jgi:ribosomal protein S18 acetylase RimI-like enzyme
MEMGERRTIAPEPAGEGDLEKLLALRYAAGAWMRARGDPSPTTAGSGLASRLAAWISRGEVYVVREGGLVIGHVRLTQEANPEIWGARGSDGSAGYIGMLGRDPEHSSPGTGKLLLIWAEGAIATGGRGLARLDTLTANPRLRRYYQEHGYGPVGSAVFEGLGLTLFEKRLG